VDPRPETPKGLTLGRALERAAATRLGVRFLDRRERDTLIPYRELLAAARRVAAGLRRLGLRRGERVALILPTGPGFYHAFFGASLAGAVPVPLYPPVRLGLLDEYHQRTAEMLRACGARLVLTETAIRRILGPTVERARPPLGCLTVAELPDGQPSDDRAAIDDVAFIQFSSGTTGAPKPIQLTHRQVLANASLILDQIMTSYPEEGGLVHRGVSWLPLYHDMGLVGCVLVALLHPGELTLIPPELFVARPAVWLRAISRFKGTVSPAPNFAYALCAERVTDEEITGVDLSSWRLALNGAEPVTPGVLERFIRRFAQHGLRPEALTPVYGLAEATLAVTFSDVRHPFRWRRFDRRRLNGEGVAAPTDEGTDGEALVDLGRPLPGFQLRVVSPGGVELPEGRIGRILVRGPSVMQGYHGESAATAAVLDTEGWLDTGDLGFLLDARLFLHGRAKDVVIINGRNHAPQAVEHALEGLAGMRAGCCAAVGIVPSGGDGEELALLLERARSGPRDDEALARAARERVASRTGLVPRRVLVLEPGTLPRTSSGKIRRAEARRRLLAGELRPPRPVSAVRMAGELLRSALALARARHGP